MLCVSIPVFPLWMPFLSSGLFIIYMIFAKIRISRAYTNWTLAYILFFLLSVLWALKARLVFYVVAVNLLPIIVMSFATISFVKRNKSIDAVLAVIYAVAILMLLYLATHIGEFLVGVRLSDSLNEVGEENVWNSNGVGINLCFAVFSGFILFVNRERKLYIRILYFASVAIMTGAILLTGSRKSLLILAFPVLFFLLKKMKRHFVSVVLVTLLMAFLFYELTMNVEVFYQAIGVRIEEMINILTNNTVGNEDTSRIQLVRFGLKKFLDHPFLGVGINNYRVLSEQIYPGKNFYAHNNYVELLVDVGLIGLIIYYSAYVYIFHRLRKHSDEGANWGKAFVLILVFLGFFEVLYYEPLEQMFFCLCFCMDELNDKKLLNKKKSSDEKNDNGRYHSARLN